MRGRNYKLATRKKEVRARVASALGVSALSSLLLMGYYTAHAPRALPAPVPAAVHPAVEIPPEAPEMLPTSDSRPAYQKINYDNPTLQRALQDHRFEPGFFPRLEQLCQDLDIHCMSLLSVMHAETGGIFSPTTRNRYNGASGLIQFTNQTARTLHTTLPEIRRMSQVEQLRLVEKYFRVVKTWNHRVDYRNPREVALSVFYPRATGRGDNFVVAERGSLMYRQNSSLDFLPPYGKITAREYVHNAVAKGYY